MSLLFVVSLGAAAQDTYPWEEYLREVMTAEDAESSAWEEVYDQLCELSLHPFDINTATRSQLEDLPFLSAQQIEEIVEYLYRYGPMKSKGELLMIRSLDEPSRQLLSSVCYVGEPARPAFPSVKEIARYGHHELMATARVPFEEKNEDYLGSSLRHWMRYQFNYGSYVKLGLLGANDAGDPFFANRNRWGYDYYAFYLQLKGLGRLESLCLGHYRVTMGMGLVMNSQSGFGKVAMLQSLGRSQTTLRAHSSRTDNYLQGAAATLRLTDHLSFTGFFSYRSQDATLNRNGTAATILSSSYHRTQGEMDKKHNLEALKTGGSLIYTYRGLHVDLNTLYAHLSRRLQPNTALLYRQHYPQGRDFFNTSLSYGYASRRLSLNGETAIDKSGHLATNGSIPSAMRRSMPRAIVLEGERKTKAASTSASHGSPRPIWNSWPIPIMPIMLGRDIVCRSLPMHGIICCKAPFIIADGPSLPVIVCNSNSATMTRRPPFCRSHRIVSV